MCILAAGDEVDLTRLLCRALEQAGYSVDACFNGQEVLTYFLGARSMTACCWPVSGRPHGNMERKK